MQLSVYGLLLEDSSTNVSLNKLITKRNKLKTTLLMRTLGKVEQPIYLLGPKTIQDLIRQEPKVKIQTKLSDPYGQSQRGPGMQVF